MYDLLSNISLCTLLIGLTVLQIKVYAMRISIPLFVCGSKFPKSHKSSRTCCYFYSWGSVDDACLLQTHSIFGLVVYTFFKFILCGTFLCIVRCLFCIHFGLFLFLPHTRFLFLSRNQPKSMFWTRSVYSCPNQCQLHHQLDEDCIKSDPYEHAADNSHRCSTISRPQCI